MEIDSTAALVTGAASGLGRAAALRLHEAGAKLVCVDTDGDRGRELADAGVGAFVLADVTSAAEVAVAVDRASALGPLRVAVNCAGVGWGARIVDRDGNPHDLDLFRKVVEINLVGTFNVLRLAAAAMAANEPTAAGERGIIVNTASIAAFEGQVGQAAYASSKGGVVGLTLAAARDLASLGIRVVSIAPGLFDTPMLDLIPEPTREALTQAMASPRRFGQTREYASLVLEIVRNAYLNGETIRLDAGLRMMPR
jgi:NAD(P)-dependent dehydrogenase (short-subunit alcohol dehydrogenase family)